MKRIQFVFPVFLILAGMFLSSCGSSGEQNASKTEDTTLTQNTSEAGIPEEFRKEWVGLYQEEGKYYEPCNPTTIQFRQNKEGDWQLLQSDLLSAESPKTIVLTKNENNRLTLCSIGHEGDTLYYVLEEKSLNGIINISFYASEDAYRKKEKTTASYYARGEFKDVVPPAPEECDFGDQPEVFIDSSYVVDNTFCNLSNGEEETRKLQFRLTCRKDGTMSGTANHDVGVGLAQFSRGSWQMEGQGISFTIITAGQFPANGDSLVEYSSEISIGAFYELQAYRQCK